MIVNRWRDPGGKDSSRPAGTAEGLVAGGSLWWQGEFWGLPPWGWGWGGDDAVHKKNPKHRDSVLLGYAPNVTPNSISGFSEPLGHWERSEWKDYDVYSKDNIWSGCVLCWVIMLLGVVTLQLSGDTNQAFQCQDSLHNGTEEDKECHRKK